MAGEKELTPAVKTTENFERRVIVADTDKGRELSEQIADLRELLKAYRSGLIKERKDASR